MLVVIFLSVIMAWVSGLGGGSTRYREKDFAPCRLVHVQLSAPNCRPPSGFGRIRNKS